MITAGVGDYAAVAFFIGKGRDLVVGASQLKRPDRLKVFRLEVKLAAVFDSARIVEMRWDQLCAYGNATQARLRFANIVESDDGKSPLSSREMTKLTIVILSGEQTSLREVHAESKDP